MFRTCITADTGIYAGIYHTQIGTVNFDFLFSLVMSQMRA